MTVKTMTTRLTEKDQARLDRLLQRIEREAEHFIGYPCNLHFDYRPLFAFLGHSLNNLGDPFVASNYHLNTHELECDVIKTFYRLTHADPASSWGYVTNGGTEGNMYGLFLARELFPDGVVYYSEDTHYSVSKILRALRMRSIMIKSQPDGRMDLEDLRETVRTHRDVPPIVFANVGTTMKGAIDDLAGIRGLFCDLAIHRHYLHADAALSGMILPFVDNPQPWDFRAGIDSISISGHKMIGSPMPCGVVLAKKATVDRIARSIEYVGTLDTTLSGSRNAITPLFLWYALHSMKLDGFRRLVDRCFEMADYTIEAFGRRGYKAWRHENSITVVFDRPAQDVVRKWQLAVLEKTAHVITMPHVRAEQIEELLCDIARAAKKGNGR